MARVRITIDKRGYIPGLGMGPINHPVFVTKETVEHLKTLGYPVKVIESKKPVVSFKEVKVSSKLTAALATPTNETKNDEELTNVEDKIENTKKEEEPDENTQSVNNPQSQLSEEDSKIAEAEEEDASSEDAEDSVLVDDPDLSANAYYTEAFLTSKNLCKKILDARGVQYSKSAGLVILQDLIAKSNPEVEFVD